MTSRALVLVVACIAASTGCRLAYTGGAKPVNAADVAANNEMLHSAPTPEVKQVSREDCGVAALAIVAGAWGMQWSVVEMERTLKPTKAGLKLGVIREFARQRGLDAYAIKGTFADLEHELRAGRPVLLGLVLPFDQNNNLNHYEVAVAIDPRTHVVITRDPATGGLMRREQNVLDLEWKTAGYATLVVVGNRSSSLNPETKENDHVEARNGSSDGVVRRVGMQ
jgi:ABC-type bacteriocin/lantibiotic exporter with double-glycine peptidase domain